MLDYWRGQMNWPLDAGWKCEVCGSDTGKLTWGLLHARCRCDCCHVEYSMRDWGKPDHPVVTRPICMLKPEYLDVAKLLWQEKQTPLSTWTSDELGRALAALAASKTGRDR